MAFFEGSLDQPVEAVSSPELCDFVAQWAQALKFLGHLKQRMGHKSSLSL